MGRYALVVFSNPVAGREDEYNDWYSNRHLKDVVSIPGFASAQRFRRQALIVGDLKHDYLAIYEMDVDGPEAVEAAKGALATTPMEISGALDSEGILAGVFEVCGPRAVSPAGGAAGKYRMVALSDAAAGRDAEFNAWYDSTHIREVSSAAGYVSGQRHKLQSGMGGEFGAPYFAVYGMEADTAESAGVALQGLMGSNLSMSDTVSPEATALALYETISPLVAAPPEKAKA
jgi:hypothetical protein